MSNLLGHTIVNRRLERMVAQRWLSRAVYISGVVAMGVALFPAVARAQVYQMMITDSSFSPSKISADTDHSVRINIYNKGNKTHNFVLPAFYIFTPNLRAGERTWVEFTPDKKGKFLFYSDTGGAKELGLSGEIDVR